MCLDLEDQEIEAVNYFQDEDGNILELEEVGSQDIIDSELVIEEEDVDFGPGSKL